MILRHILNVIFRYKSNRDHFLTIFEDKLEIYINTQSFIVCRAVADCATGKPESFPVESGTYPEISKEVCYEK